MRNTLLYVSYDLNTILLHKKECRKLLTAVH